jgi:hypothetical protein
VWVELTYDTPVYMTSIQIRQVYNIGSIHKIEVFTNGGFTTVWGRHIDTVLAGNSALTSVLPVNCTESIPSQLEVVLPILTLTF